MSQTTIAPVRVSIRIDQEVAEVFRVFTQETASWWPLATHSIAADTHGGRVRAETVVFEGRVGGRIYERMSDGAEADWGAVLVWEPPHRVVFSWKPNLTPGPMTEVEVRFVAEGATTRVDLEHRAWERLADRALEQRRLYEGGWPVVLGLFAERAGGRA